MRTKNRPTPVGRRTIKAIERLKARGEPTSLDRLAVVLDRSKNAVKESLERLKRDGWIKWGPFKPGVGRAITLR